MIQALIIAFAMYSKIPMPMVEWNKKNMKYALCFFPAVGVVIGLALWGLLQLCQYGKMSTFFTAVALTILPILITGGIHMDGFLDTVDALSSNASRERKLEILKDPNSGAFAITFGIVYLISYVAVLTEMNWKALPEFALSFVMIRTLSGLSIASFPLARNTGLAATFQDHAHKRNVSIILLLMFLGEVAVLFSFGIVLGGITLGTLALMFVHHYYQCKRKFGGITGDLAGFYLQLSELAVAFALMLVGKIGVV